MQEKIKEYLEKNGIKQTHIQRQLGISRSACNAMLNGKRKMTAQEYLKICQVLKVPADYFGKDLLEDEPGVAAPVQGK